MPSKLSSRPKQTLLSLLADPTQPPPDLKLLLDGDKSCMVHGCVLALASPVLREAISLLNACAGGKELKVIQGHRFFDMGQQSRPLFGTGGW